MKINSKIYVPVILGFMGGFIQAQIPNSLLGIVVGSAFLFTAFCLNHRN